MATTSTKLLHLRPKLKSFPPPKPFSSSSSSNPNTENTPHPPQPPNTETTPTHKPLSFSSIANNPPNPSSSKSSAHFDQLRKSLAQLRLRAETPSPPSFQHLSKDNVGHDPNRKFDFSSIRANLRKFNEKDTRNESNDKGKLFDSLSLSRLKDSLKLRPDMDTDVKGGGGGMVIGGGSGNLPSSIFGREMMMMRDKEGVGGGENERMKGDFDRLYSYGELGEKLNKLRQVKKGEKGAFSLHELKERLVKVRESDERETTSKSMIGDDIYRHLKVSLFKLKHDDDEEKAKKKSIQRFDILEHLGGTPSFMLNPPKEHLVEKYFHPDHMSSGEKMKLELQKVRDEFKMSESDCGSARVQVAQLTTKIKHLSTVLHKKDKHSRKGLQEMVQKRKKLLKYLRKTDWDSYCLVLSKLGLRDNPDYKF